MKKLTMQEKFNFSLQWHVQSLQNAKPMTTNPTKTEDSEPMSAQQNLHQMNQKHLLRARWKKSQELRHQVHPEGVGLKPETTTETSKIKIGSQAEDLRLWAVNPKWVPDPNFVATFATSWDTVTESVVPMQAKNMDQTFAQHVADDTQHSAGRT